MALGLLESMEELFLGLAARQLVLSHLELDGDNYSDLVEKAEILMADRVRAVFAPLRASCGQCPEPDHLPSDLDSIVRRAVDSLRANDFWQD
jgi:hypothetical protein